MTTVCWLVEHPKLDGPFYLTAEGNTTAGYPGGFCWQTAAYSALRFPRRDDAVLLVNALRSLYDLLPYGQGLRGMHSGDDYPLIVEHVFI